MRYSIKYTKDDQIKFVGHLDLMRTIQRIFRRAELPTEYSKGFNPHMTLSIAQPLSVGMASSGEYLDVSFVEEVDEKIIIDKLNQHAPNGIKILDAIKVKSTDKKIPQSMALIDGAQYILKFKYTDKESILKEIEEITLMDKWEIDKKTKKGMRLVDLKPMIFDFKHWIKDEYLVVNILSACGSKQNLSASVLGEFIRQNCKSIDKDKFINIKRQEMYTYKDDELVSLQKFFANV